MREHVLQLLLKWEDGTIPRLQAPVLPIEVASRGFGDLTLGQRTVLAEERIATRKAQQDAHMQDAVDNPGKFSPFVRIDSSVLQALTAIDGAVASEDEPEGTEPCPMLNRKVEVRWLMHAERGGEKTTFLHCFEGTIKGVVPYTPGRKQKLDLDFGQRKPIALVRWDAEFGFPDSYFPLDLDAYAKEDRHFGWNMLTDEYVRAFSEAPVDDGNGAEDNDTSDEYSSGSDSTDSGED
jgi:hypothetical protein